MANKQHIFRANGVAINVLEAGEGNPTVLLLEVAQIVAARQPEGFDGLVLFGAAPATPMTVRNEIGKPTAAVMTLATAWRR